MKRRSALVALFLTFASVATASFGADENELSIPGVCTIGTPGKGWSWKPVSEFDPQKGGIYLCTADMKPGKLILSIEAKALTTDADRINTLKVHFNSLRQSLEKLGCTDIKGKRPSITPPIPANVDYIVFGKLPSGNSVYYHAHTIFKNNVYLVQAAAPSLAEAQKLSDVAKTLVAAKPAP